MATLFLGEHYTHIHILADKFQICLGNQLFIINTTRPTPTDCLENLK